MFRHILLPTDGTQFSQNAVDQTVKLAKVLGARITTLFVKRPYLAAYYSDDLFLELPLPNGFESLSDKDANLILESVEKHCTEAGVNCSKLTMSSDVVYESIIEAATRNDCDLICMASHGRRGVSALLLGSETNKVLTHSRIPVLVYR